MTRDVLEMDGVGFTYNPGRRNAFQALADVSLVVPAGEVVALVGQSGSGKSTLLGLASLLFRPTEGAIRLAGHETAHLGSRRLTDLRRRYVGIITQRGDLAPSLTAIENVLYTMHRAGREETRARAVAALEALGLPPKVQRLLPAKLSGGEYQRVAIARAIAKRPAVMFADEPTSALDSRNARLVMEALVTNRPPGSSLFLVTHDERLVSEYATWRYRIEDGRVASA